MEKSEVDYKMMLICDMRSEAHDREEFPHVYRGESRESCKEKAERDGWVFMFNERAGEGTLVCPKCMGSRSQNIILHRIEMGMKEAKLEKAKNIIRELWDIRKEVRELKRREFELNQKVSALNINDQLLRNLVKSLEKERGELRKWKDDVIAAWYDTNNITEFMDRVVREGLLQYK